MAYYTKGQYLEVGIGDFDDSEEGLSMYMYIDIDGIKLIDIDKLFDREILYVNQCDDEELQNFDIYNPISILLNYVK